LPRRRKGIDFFQNGSGPAEGKSAYRMHGFSGTSQERLRYGGFPRPKLGRGNVGKSEKGEYIVLR